MNALKSSHKIAKKPLQIRLGSEISLEKIWNASLRLLAPLESEETYKIIIQEATKLTRTKQGSIFLKQHGHLYRTYSSVTLKTQLEPRKNGYTYRAMRSKRPIVITNKILMKTYPLVVSSGIRSFIIIPLTVNKETIGVITLQAEHDSIFDEKSLETLKLFGSMASIAIRKAQLHSELVQAIKTKDLFISLAAHEFRTPLTSIYGFGQLIQMNMQKDKPLKKRWVDSLVSESERLNKLINEFLRTDNLAMNTLSYKWKRCSVDAVINRAIEDITFSYPKKRIVYKNEIPHKKDSIIGDFDKLLQVMLNVLSNAAKFSDEESPISVHLTVHDAQVHIRVTDQGKGVKKKDLPKVFEGFFKADRKKDGMGLGLYLTKTIIDAHNGRISLTSKTNHGTTVHIELPALYHEAT